MSKNKKEKKQEINKVESESEQIKKFIKTVIIICICFAGVYGITILLSKKGAFEQGYTPLETEEATISTKNIIIGSVFNRPEKDYYVAFGDFSDSYTTQYYSYLIQSTEKRVYSVDMSLGINKNYISDSSNKKAKKDSELKIKEPTLIRIKKGKIVSYFDDIESIKKELQ